MDNSECILIPQEGLSEGTMESSLTFREIFRNTSGNVTGRINHIFLEYYIIATVSAYYVLKKCRRTVFTSQAKFRFTNGPEN